MGGVGLGWYVRGGGEGDEWRCWRGRVWGVGGRVNQAMM